MLISVIPGFVIGLIYAVWIDWNNHPAEPKFWTNMRVVQTICTGTSTVLAIAFSFAWHNDPAACASAFFAAAVGAVLFYDGSFVIFEWCMRQARYDREVVELPGSWDWSKKGFIAPQAGSLPNNTSRAVSLDEFKNI